jgi:hypothetical protein
MDGGWITRPNQAAAKAAQIGVRQSTPYDQITARIREGVIKARGLDVGGQFILDLSADSYRAVCRIVELSGYDDAGGAIDCQIETERLIGPSVAQLGYETSQEDEEVALTDLPYFSVLQAPEALAAGDKYNLITLAGRTQGLVRGYNVWWRRNGSDAFNELGYARHFAVPLELAADLLASGPDDDETGNILIREYPSNVPLGFADIPGTQTPEEIEDETLLLIVVSASDPQHYEILTVKSVESPVGDDYPVFARRGRLGSVKRDHLAGAQAWLVFRSSLNLFFNLGFEGIATASNAAARTINIKPQPNSASSRLELDSASAYALELFEQFTEVIYDGNA